MEINKRPSPGSYSCSNVNNSPVLPKRNFLFMTLTQLIDYWEEMEEKFKKRENRKYNRELLDSVQDNNEIIIYDED